MVARGSREVLVEYRRRGGMAGLNQRLVVHDDGQIELDDRRARKVSTAMASEDELSRLREALAQVANEHWSRWPQPSLGWLTPGTHNPLRVEIRRGSRRIAPSAEEEDELAPIIAELDSLLSRTVRERRA